VSGKVQEWTWDLRATARPTTRRAELFEGRVLVVNARVAGHSELSEALRETGLTLEPAGDAAAATQRLQTGDYAAVVYDTDVVDASTLHALRAMTRLRPDVPLIVLTVASTIAAAVSAMKAGVFEFLTEPVADSGVRDVLRRALAWRTPPPRESAPADGVIGLGELGLVSSGAGQMREVCDLAEAVADSHATVLMHGETGTGKSMLARAIHLRSRRRERPFVEVNCGAIHETLLESELFGHVKGAFTGAFSDKDGKFRAAEGGTVFLDEISCASPALQVKLLRFLQDKHFEPLGSNVTMTADVRVILATNVDLQQEIAAGRFRKDLYYRINVVNIDLPPLRERLTDIPLLAEVFLQKYCARNGKALSGFADEAMQCMQHYLWPGNVRELENCVERAVVLTRNHCVMRDDLPPALLRAVAHAAASTAVPPPPRSLRQALAEPEREIIQAALQKNGWRRSATAQALNINRTTLYKKMKRYGLQAPAARRRAKS